MPRANVFVSKMAPLQGPKKHRQKITERKLPQIIPFPGTKTEAGGGLAFKTSTFFPRSASICQSFLLGKGLGRSLSANPSTQLAHLAVL
jgi:hypothetical protein